MILRRRESIVKESKNLDRECCVAEKVKIAMYDDVFLLCVYVENGTSIAIETR